MSSPTPAHLTASSVQSPSAVLRSSTADAHTRAERSPFQRAMISGRLPRAQYLAFLIAMRAVWRTLEEVAPRIPAGAARATLLDPQRFRTSDIDRDLAHLGAESAVANADGTNAAATDFAARIRALADASPTALLGVLYVLEGSTNGGRYIARSLRRAFALTGEDGIAFQDPYGDAQPELWAAWKTALDRVVMPSDVPLLVATAKETFDAIGRIGDEVLRAVPAGD